MKKILTIAFSSVVIDQMSKIFIESGMEVGNTFFLIDDFFAIRYIRNTGAAWGILSDSTILLALMSILFLFFLFRYLLQDSPSRVLPQVAFGILIGGIVGNLIDRLIRRYVVDFLSFTFFQYRFPVFNLADTFIVVSVMLLIIDSFLGGDFFDIRSRKEKN